MKRVYRRLIAVIGLAATLSLSELPAFSSDIISQTCAERELLQAMTILDRIIADGGEDAAAHELRGDVFAARGLSLQAQREYEKSASMSLNNEPHLLSRK